MHEIRMQHPGKNALGTDLIGWLDEELDRAGHQPILLTGTGDAFSAGLNLKDVHAADRQGMETMLSRLDWLYSRLYRHPAPTVALVNGHAIAGGCILMLCCDWRVATDEPKARIGINEVAIGAIMPPVALNIVKRRIPPHTLEKIVFGAGLHAPDVALTLGLVDEISADAPAAAAKRLHTLASYPRASYAATKKGLRAGVTSTTDEDMWRFRQDEVPLWVSTEMKDRVAAVLNRK